MHQLTIPTLILHRYSSHAFPRDCFPNYLWVLFSTSTTDSSESWKACLLARAAAPYTLELLLDNTPLPHLRTVYHCLHFLPTQLQAGSPCQGSLLV